MGKVSFVIICYILRRILIAGASVLMECGTIWNRMEINEDLVSEALSVDIVDQFSVFFDHNIAFELQSRSQVALFFRQIHG